MQGLGENRKDQTSKELTRLNYTLCFGPSMVAVHDHHLPRKFWSGVSSSDMNTLRHLLRNPIWQASTIARRQGENFASIWKIWNRGHRQFLKYQTTKMDVKGVTRNTKTNANKITKLINLGELC